MLEKVYLLALTCNYGLVKNQMLPNLDFGLGVNFPAGEIYFGNQNKLSKQFPFIYDYYLARESFSSQNDYTRINLLIGTMANKNLI